MTEEAKNVCDFKKCCKTCTFCTLEERPGKCITIKCPEFKPCTVCGNNNHVNDRGQCVKCQHAKAAQKHEARRNEYLKKLEEAKQQASQQSILQRLNPGLEPEAQRQILSQLPEEKAAKKKLKNDADHLPERKFSITPPGNPPSEMNEEEKKYYYQRWGEYKGYYGNPAAYFIVHQIIQEEIYISQLTTEAFATRGERLEDTVKARETAYKMLATLRSQLPEKEADELSDHEKSLAGIYDAFTKEKAKKYVGGVSRMLSPSAIALAPNLTHPLNPRDLLQRCGYNLTTMEELIDRYETISVDEKSEQTPENVDAVMQFFGYRLKEKYAMEFKTLEFEETAAGEVP